MKQLRQRLGLTQHEMAATLGCRQQTISEWELGLDEPANAYGKLLDQLEKQARLSSLGFSSRGLVSHDPHPEPRTSAGSIKQPPPRAETPVPVEIPEAENPFDKSFDPALD